MYRMQIKTYIRVITYVSCPLMSVKYELCSTFLRAYHCCQLNKKHAHIKFKQVTCLIMLLDTCKINKLEDKIRNMNKVFSLK